ncbi:Decaprenyl diphosphate synthase-like protein [Glomus cerebriforme]|uniref:ditrans,polycis-polyprenyl diphosphate synthase [(2E,6E)-farnesyldiphosphate specific] n=1 Tax=Glomus cerebriforme TaxID=658196 RepID=A0A397TBQ0_9GLOM|nr:Decaprenyl diphosphate synthase-like protein [Glomus cerebriforme]
MVSTEILLIPLLIIGLVIISYRRPSLIYNFLLMILQSVYLLYKLYLSIPSLFLRRRTTTNATQLFGDDIKYLDKIPKHLAVMFWNDDVQEERLIEVAQLCCWSWCFGVKIVSIYEPEGHLKNYAHLLQSHINIISREFITLEKIIPTIQVMSLNSSSSIGNETNQSDLLVNLVSRSDGRARIVETTKSITKDVIQEKIKCEDVNVQELDKRLSISQFPEPQLLILFSPRIDLDGFPPWHIHLTEIFHVPDNQKFSYSIFLQGLRKYSRCNQRFGK